MHNESAVDDTSFDPDQLESINGADLLEQVSQFIGRYLQCSEHQRTVLALWVLHTHCSTAAQVSPYLAIQSAQKQSGKTLCLQLLNLLCDFPALTAGFTANALTRRIDGPISTVLLDECQATVGSRGRSKGPTLRAILASGYHCGLGYTDATHERNAFCPKAFAGMGQLPEALADRSIPIILEQLEASSTAKPRVQRFDLRRAIKEAKPLQEHLHEWMEENLPDLEAKPVYSEEDFPPNLSPRRRDMSEPLLQLADFIGGPWPIRIREALTDIFQAETAFELRYSRQLLADLRDCFAHNNYPERLSTAALLDWMHTLPTRPWDVEGSITARTFARLLLAFDIHPRVQRIGSAAPARGYQLQDFIEPWQTHLGFAVVPIKSAEPLSLDVMDGSGFVSSDDPMSRRPDDPIACTTTALDKELKAFPTTAIGELETVTAHSYSQIPNKDAGCDAVTDSGTISNPSVVHTWNSNGDRRMATV
ncbi:MAG TPA: DUF3631 domain-containing protein [Candidatus Angelobacter sp.]